MKTETQAQMALRVCRQFIEREARQYPSARSRHDCRDRLRKLHNWKQKLESVKKEKLFT